MRVTRTYPWHAVAIAVALVSNSNGCCKGVPDPEAERRDELDLSGTTTLPLAVHAGPRIDAPTVRIDGEQVTVDGVPCGQIGSEAASKEVQALLANKRALWEQINPGRTYGGDVLLEAARTTSGDRAAAMASAVLKAGFPRLHIAVRGVAKGDGCMTVRLLSIAGEEPDGLRLDLGPPNMAITFWKKAGIESAPEPVALTEGKRPNGTMWLPGLESAVGRASAAHKDDRHVAVVLGVERVSLAKLVAVSDVFAAAKYEVTWRVPAD